VQTAEVVASTTRQIPLDPADGAWDETSEHTAKLVLQDLVEPRLMKASTAEVKVRALTNGSDIAFRMAWTDPDKSDMPGPSRFVDACAVQLPKKLEKDPPAPQMGETGRQVEVTYWRADWQASVGGRGDTIQDLYPRATIDHYPFEAKSLEKGSAEQKEMARRYSPADAVGNRRSGPRETPVEDLVADGPGTLIRAPETTSKGKGQRSRDGWAVVISRRLPQGLTPRGRTQIAFAVWEGSSGESGARKMRTGWVPLLVEGGR
jgi:DMSO reductase family type II enzyme heme b subunit